MKLTVQSWAYQAAIRNRICFLVPFEVSYIFDTRRTRYSTHISGVQDDSNVAQPCHFINSPVPSYSVSLSSNSALREMLLSTSRGLLASKLEEKSDNRNSPFAEGKRNNFSIDGNCESQPYPRIDTTSSKFDDRRSIDGKVFIEDFLEAYPHPDCYFFSKEFWYESERDWCWMCNSMADKGLREHLTTGGHDTSRIMYKTFLSLYPYHRRESVLRRWAFLAFGRYPVNLYCHVSSERRCTTASPFPLIPDLCDPTDLVLTGLNLRKALSLLIRYGILNFSVSYDDERHAFDRMEWIGDQTIYCISFEIISALIGSDPSLCIDLCSRITSNAAFETAYRFLDLDQVLTTNKSGSVFTRPDIFEAIIGELQHFLWSQEVELHHRTWLRYSSQEINGLRVLALHCQYTMVVLHVLLFFQSYARRQDPLLNRAFKNMESEGNYLKSKGIHTSLQLKRQETMDALGALNRNSNNVSGGGRNCVLAPESIDHSMYRYIIKLDPTLARYVTYPECLPDPVRTQLLPCTEADRFIPKDSSEQDASSSVLRNCTFLVSEDGVEVSTPPEQHVNPCLELDIHCLGPIDTYPDTADFYPPESHTCQTTNWFILSFSDDLFTRQWSAGSYLNWEKFNSAQVSKESGITESHSPRNDISTGKSTHGLPFPINRRRIATSQLPWHPEILKGFNHVLPPPMLKKEPSQAPNRKLSDDATRNGSDEPSVSQSNSLTWLTGWVE